LGGCFAAGSSPTVLKVVGVNIARFVTIAMVGLDQDLMQKIATIGEAQKNMFAFTGIFVLINIFF
jgi:hypothetical protein